MGTGAIQEGTLLERAIRLAQRYGKGIEMASNSIAFFGSVPLLKNLDYKSLLIKRVLCMLNPIHT